MPWPSSCQPLRRAIMQVKGERRIQEKSLMKEARQTYHSWTTTLEKEQQMTTTKTEKVRDRMTNLMTIE